MDGQMIISMNGEPIFFGNKYKIWKVKMRAYLRELRCDVWNSIITGSTPPNNVITIAQKDARKNNSVNDSIYYHKNGKG